MSIAIIDYGSGNLHSAAKAFERAARDSGLATQVLVTSDPDALRRAERIVLPGVGAFKDCRDGLQAVPGLWETLEEQVITRAIRVGDRPGDHPEIAPTDHTNATKRLPDAPLTAATSPCLTFF